MFRPSGGHLSMCLHNGIVVAVDNSVGILGKQISILYLFALEFYTSRCWLVDNMDMSWFSCLGVIRSAFPGVKGRSYRLYGVLRNQPFTGPVILILEGSSQVFRFVQLQYFDLLWVNRDHGKIGVIHGISP